MTLINALESLPASFYTQIEELNIVHVTTGILQKSMDLSEACHVKVTAGTMLLWSHFGGNLSEKGFMESTLKPVRKQEQLYLN